MTKDRLKALMDGREEDIYIPEVHESVVELEEDAMEAFFKQVEDLQDMVDSIVDNIKRVKTMHGEILADPNNDRAHKQQLEDVMVDIKKTANKVRTKLNVIKQDIEQEEAANPVDANLRIKKTQQAVLSKKFINAMNDYNLCQVTYREKCKERIQRQLAITGRQTTDDELEEMIESGNPQIFTQGIVMDTVAAKKSLADIEARHQDIMKLENSIRELHDMFMDMAILVESQGEMIDRIEYNVEQAVYHVKSAADDTKKAVKFQAKARRKKICLIGILIGVLLVIAIIIVISVCVQGNCTSNNNNSQPNAQTSQPPVTTQP